MEWVPVAAAVGLILGSLIHRWALMVVLAVVGAAVIAVDVSTRNLVGAGHDDTGLVLMAELVLLPIVIATAALGIALGRSRLRHPRRKPQA